MAASLGCRPSWRAAESCGVPKGNRPPAPNLHGRAPQQGDDMVELWGTDGGEGAILAQVSSDTPWAGSLSGGSLDDGGAARPLGVVVVAFSLLI